MANYKKSDNKSSKAKTNKVKTGYSSSKPFDMENMTTGNLPTVVTKSQIKVPAFITDSLAKAAEEDLEIEQLTELDLEEVVDTKKSSIRKMLLMVFAIGKSFFAVVLPKVKAEIEREEKEKLESIKLHKEALRRQHAKLITLEQQRQNAIAAKEEAAIKEKAAASDNNPDLKKDKRPEDQKLDQQIKKEQKLGQDLEATKIEALKGKNSATALEKLQASREALAARSSTESKLQTQAGFDAFKANITTSVISGLTLASKLPVQEQSILKTVLDNFLKPTSRADLQVYDHHREQPRPLIDRIIQKIAPHVLEVIDRVKQSAAENKSEKAHVETQKSTVEQKHEKIEQKTEKVEKSDFKEKIETATKEVKQESLKKDFQAEVSKTQDTSSFVRQ